MERLAIAEVGLPDAEHAVFRAIERRPARSPGDGLGIPQRSGHAAGDSVKKKKTVTRRCTAGAIPGRWARRLDPGASLVSYRPRPCVRRPAPAEHQACFSVRWGWGFSGASAALGLGLVGRALLQRRHLLDLTQFRQNFLLGKRVDGTVADEEPVPAVT